MESLPAAGVGRLTGDTPEGGGVGFAFDAVVLAGGRASRLGGFPKPRLVFEGQTLLDHALDATRLARAVVVVGPGEDEATPGPPRVRRAVESPRYAGPLAALAVGLDTLRRDRQPEGPAPWVAVLAADLPRAGAALAPLLEAADAEPPADVVLGEDGAGRAQPLLAVYRRAPLERVLALLDDDGGLANRPLRHLVARLTVLPLRLPPGLADDVDTWQAAERWGIRRPEGPGAPKALEELEMSEESPAAKDAKEQDTQEVLRSWCAELLEALELNGLDVDIDAVLGLAGVAAHSVVRPAAPLTTFIAAYAAGFAAGSGQAGEKVAMESAIDVARRLSKARGERAGSGE
jgi:molybdopterin-guanine dinucleotide biosynthesis protein A